MLLLLGRLGGFLLLLGLREGLLILLLLLLVELLLQLVLGCVLGFGSELGRGGCLLLECLHLLEQGQVDVGLLLLLQLELVLALLPFGFLLLVHSLLVELLLLLFHLLLEQNLVGRLDADLLVGSWLGDELGLLGWSWCSGFRWDFRLCSRFRRLKDYRGHGESGHFSLAQLLLVFGRWRSDHAIADRNGHLRRRRSMLNLLLTR